MADCVGLCSLCNQLGLCLFFVGLLASAQSSSQGSFAQIASGSGITTTIVLVNTGGVPAHTHVGFYVDEGGPLSLPLTLPQTGISMNTSSLNQTIAPNATFIAVSTEPSNLPPLVGSARVTSDGRVDGFVIYHFAWSGQEAIVPMETRAASAYMLPFVNPPFGSTGIAIANTATGNVDVSVWMQVGGTYIGLGTLTVPASGHTSFVLDQKFPSTTWLPTSIIQFRAPTAGQISVIGLTFDPLGHTTALPVLTDATPFSGSVAQIATGDGIGTAIVLRNIGSAAANMHVRFFADDGSPLSVAGGATGCSPSVGFFSSIDRTFGPA